MINTDQGRLIFSDIRDITKERALEEALSKANNELQASNKELEAFSYSVSHDLRAPLRSIDGFSQILLEDSAGHLDDDGRSHLNRIRSATQRMGQLIDDMLTLSRVTRAEMNLKDVDLSGLARKVTDALHEAEPSRQVSVMIAPSMHVFGDERLLRIALENLLGNAWKFTSKTPDARIEFGQESRDGSNAFYIRDNGAGFDMAYVDKLFRAFQRLHQASEFPGTGIGLATVQRVIHKHGGRIWAEATPGHGAQFYFRLQT